jgi:hypothetical protein
VGQMALIRESNPNKLIDVAIDEVRMDGRQYLFVDIKITGHHHVDFEIVNIQIVDFQIVIVQIVDIKI